MINNRPVRLAVVFGAAFVGWLVGWLSSGHPPIDLGKIDVRKFVALLLQIIAAALVVDGVRFPPILGRSNTIIPAPSASPSTIGPLEQAQAEIAHERAQRHASQEVLTDQLNETNRKVFTAAVLTVLATTLSSI